MTYHTAAIPRGYTPPSDQCARLAAWLLLRTSATEEYRAGHFIRMPKSTWHSMFGGNDSKTKNEAIASGLIDCNQRYSTGRFPQSIRLRAEYRTGEFAEYALQRRPRSKPECKHDLQRLGSVGMRLRARMSQFALDDSAQPCDPWECYQVNRIRHRDYYSTRCDFGRFHSNFTSLSSRLRSCLTADGSRDLVSVDIQNAQPLMLVMLMQHDKNFLCGPATRQIEDTSTTHNPICGPLFFLERWKNLCEIGKIYEHCIGRLREGVASTYEVYAQGKRWVEDPKTWSREKVKRSFLTCLFCSRQDTLAQPLFRVFEQCFPPIAQFILDAKKYEYQGLAHACQRLESTLMIDQIASKFMDVRPDEPITTIHDELLVTSRSADFACDLIKQEFGRYGIRPKLRVTPLGS